MGDRLGPSGLLKASLTELNRQQMHQNVKLYYSVEFVYKMGIEAFNLLNFLSSQLLSFSPGPVRHPQKLLIIYPFVRKQCPVFSSGF
jgi:hypothetical protein